MNDIVQVLGNAAGGASVLVTPAPAVAVVATPAQVVAAVCVDSPGPQGPRGLRGAQGVQGVPGTSGDMHYTHTQASAAAVWSIVHGMAKYPSVTVLDSAGDVCEGDIRYVNTNEILITFSAAFSGIAYLN